MRVDESISKFMKWDIEGDIPYILDKRLLLRYLQVDGWILSRV